MMIPIWDFMGNCKVEYGAIIQQPDSQPIEVKVKSLLNNAIDGSIINSHLGY